MLEKDVIITITDSWVVTMDMLSFAWIGIALLLSVFVNIALFYSEEGEADREVNAALTAACFLWPLLLIVAVIFIPPFVVGKTLRLLFPKENENYG
jgi:hypothetical protein